MLQGALLAQMIFFKVLEPLEHSVQDHADPFRMFRIQWNRYSIRFLILSWRVDLWRG